jgi:hypothetical protein
MGIQHPHKGAYTHLALAQESPMTVVHHPVMPKREQNRCAMMFCLTWLGFFAAIGLVTWALSSL